ncbi:plasmid mobilization protein [Duganella vulcania]|uniref:Mobilization protein n=1 Tax=Duganella vulcania TaxID=2692166 RepID=A0A845GR52_9BURK|nr:hypothetical protein [Duganella vulcania]MYM96075.1 hypothetical protein [Duganella vulcania]
MKTKQVNIRLTEEERDQFKALALAHGVDASDYFRSKVFDHDLSTINSDMKSTEDLEKRARAAEKIIKKTELEKRLPEHILRRLAYLSSINQKLDFIVENIPQLLQPHEKSEANDLTNYLEELQQLLHGDF